MASHAGAERRARMQRKLNALTLAVGLTGATATGALMTAARAQTKTTPARSSAVQGTTTTSSVSAPTGGDALQPAQQPVARTQQAPAATSGAS